MLAEAGFGLGKVAGVVVHGAVWPVPIAYLGVAENVGLTRRTDFMDIHSNWSPYWEPCGRRALPILTTKRCCFFPAPHLQLSSMDYLQYGHYQLTPRSQALADLSW